MGQHGIVSVPCGKENILIKIAIVEDEKILLEDLEENIDWESLGIEVVFTERNGVNALRHFQKEPVDIILTDIRMPVMTGIEMAKKIKEIDNQIQIIFLTGFEDVEYMKTAIQLEAVSYISKPFQEEELHRSIKAAVKKVEMIQNAAIGKQQCYENELKNILLNDSLEINLFKEGIYTMLYAYIERFKSIYNTRSAAEVNWIVDYNTKQLHYFFRCRAEQFVVCYLSKGQFLIVVRDYFDSNHLTENDFDELNEGADPTVKLSLFIPKNTEDLSSAEFAKGYSDILHQLADNFYEGRKNRRISVTANQIKKKFCSQILSLSEREGTELITDFFHGVALEKLPKEQVLQDCFELCSSIYDMSFVGNKESIIILKEKSGLLNTLEESDNIGQIEKYITVLFVTSRNHTSAVESEMQDEEKIVKRILYYIQTHYSQPLSAENLSEEFYFASNTIRGIFKKHTGMTIHESLSRTRMEKAKELLKDPSIKIKKVAELVGYEAVSYFGMRFSKDYGMSPLAFRRTYLNHKLMLESQFDITNDKEA